MAETTQPDDGPGVERRITLTDAVVAIAMTVVVQRAVGRPVGLARLTSAVFASCTVASLFDARLGVYLLLLLVVAGRIEATSATRVTRVSWTERGDRAQPK